jgi:TolB-like protein/cytochrome c-type biogenesis protein CcmH/NrfG
MPSEQSTDVKFEIGHVLFIDIVGYSKLLITEQSERLKTLKEIIRATEQFRLANAAGKLLGLPTGDGAALVFRTNPEAPVLCALEISKALKSHPELPVRMGIHSGPVNEVTDLNEQANIAGAGINMAQRVMDCGDAGHILLSKRVADDLEEYPRWRPYLRELGECGVKHGVRLFVVNLYTDELGNPQQPKKFIEKQRTQSAWKKRTRPSVVGIVAVLSVVALAIVAMILMPTILRSRAQTQRNSPTLAKENLATVIPEKSIAVLPFENLSDDKSNAYFAVGIQDEILTKLASLADLKVISRTSTTKYKSKPEDLKTVGQQLGVGTVLEGSVQRAADKVRVNVQLIDARTDTHLWAHTYDRELKDVFAVESEVASTIAQQLNAKLTGSAQRVIADKPTQIPAAYSAYLRGLGIEHGQFSDTSNQEAAAAYAEAVRLDPNFAVAWARFSLIRSFLYFNGVDKSPSAAIEVKEAADRAITLQPDLGEGWLAQGAYRYRILRDFPGALQAYQEAEKRLPNSALVNEYMAYVERRLGRWKEAETHYLKATELDPRDYQLWRSIAEELFKYLRRFPEAQAALDRALEISPNDEGAITAKADVFQEEGRLNEAAKELASLPEDSTDNYLMLVRAFQAMQERQFDTAISWTEQITKALKPGQPVSTSKIVALVFQGYCQEWAGRTADARATFEFIVQTIAPTPGSAIAADSRGVRSFLALAYAGLGDKQAALEQARQAVADYENDAVVKPLSRAWLAKIQARFGDFDSVIADLPHLLEEPGGVMPGDLRFSPFWDPLRKDPRFQQLLAATEQIGPNKR